MKLLKRLKSKLEFSFTNLSVIPPLKQPKKHNVDLFIMSLMIFSVASHSWRKVNRTRLNKFLLMNFFSFIIINVGEFRWDGWQARNEIISFRQMACHNARHQNQIHFAFLCDVVGLFHFISSFSSLFSWQTTKNKKGKVWKMSNNSFYFISCCERQREGKNYHKIIHEIVDEMCVYGEGEIGLHRDGCLFIFKRRCLSDTTTENPFRL